MACVPSDGVTYWDAQDLTGGVVEVAYARWSERRPDWHDAVELGERVARALAEQNG